MTWARVDGKGQAVSKCSGGFRKKLCIAGVLHPIAQVCYLLLSSLTAKTTEPILTQRLTRCCFALIEVLIIADIV